LKKVAPDLGLATYLFQTLQLKTTGPIGMNRPSYGAGEHIAHQIMREAATDLKMEAATDAAGNLYLTLPGQKRDLPKIIVGSHLDSVPQGGNFDGSAGVIAGLAACSGLRQAKIRPLNDITVMCIRAEESEWFPLSYIGSRAAFGLLPPEALDVPRNDSGRTLADHIAESGYDPDTIRTGVAYLDAKTIRAFLEIHIEQGPLLDAAGIPVGIVTGIRGSRRYREAKCIGEYGHSGATPRRYRHDTVIATANLLVLLDQEWERLEADGHDLALTIGMIRTDPSAHGFSKIAGEVTFSIDMRSQSEKTLELVRNRLISHAASVELQTGVRFDLGALTESKPGLMRPEIRKALRKIADTLEISTMDLASGAGHDASVFVNQGIPSGMLFIRNQGGSHNPNESMEMGDFARATEILAAFLAGTNF
jgi:N-carbamoyl-L-amino-acid hydrolase